MQITPLAIPDVLLITPQRHGDSRGFFSETFRADWFEDARLPNLTFLQDNHAYSAAEGVLRGLHFQTGRSAQAKLVKCLRGEIIDVAVDIRKGSPSYGQHVTTLLSAENGHQLLVPPGFAHAYCTLSTHCEVFYKVNNYYDPAREAAIRWNDPDLAIDWPYPHERLILSEKDLEAPLLANLPDYFSYAPKEPFKVKIRDT